MKNIRSITTHIHPEADPAARSVSWFQHKLASRHIDTASLHTHDEVRIVIYDWEQVHGRVENFQRCIHIRFATGEDAVNWLTSLLNRGKISMWLDQGLGIHKRTPEAHAKLEARWKKAADELREMGW